MKNKKKIEKSIEIYQKYIGIHHHSLSLSHTYTHTLTFSSNVDIVPVTGQGQRSLEEAEEHL